MLLAQKNLIASRIAAAITPFQAAAGSTPPVIVLERPKVAAHGDLACNIALQTAKASGKKPREVAQAIVDALSGDAALKLLIASAEVAGPGFINFFITAEAKQAVVAAILDEGERFGIVPASSAAVREKVMVEFVSANPTGPLHLGHARQGALGDAIAALYETQGHPVTREFYYNDAGAQIAALARSVQSRAHGIAPGDPGWPEAAYNGDYIADIAADFLAGKTVVADDRSVTASGDVNDLDAVRLFAVAYVRHEQDLDLRAFGVKFDHYFLESSLYTEGRVAATVEALVAAGMTYESAGALWLATTRYEDIGDDKDRVMRKSDGTYTYFVPDVAYHLCKWQRGYRKVINVQGSDHHGTVARVRAGLRAISEHQGLGLPAIYPDYVLHKMVRVMKGGEEVKISKRAGSYVTLRDLIEMSGGAGQANPRGRDAVRFFLISRKADTEFTFDVDLALAQSDENPVYYVQYAHARICSVLALWGGGDWESSLAALAHADLSPLVAPREAALMQRLAEFPEVLALAASEMAPHQVAFYLKDCAADLHSYYNAERVLVDDVATRTARIALLAATRRVLASGLALVGVSAPQKMLRS